MKRYRTIDCICSECKERSFTKVMDDGIGSYEYWGCHGVDSNEFVVSECCEAKALDVVTEKEIEVWDLR